MRIVLISNMTPASENIRGTSALPYHLIKGIKAQTLKIRNKQEDISFSIWSFNLNNLDERKQNESAKELETDIHIIPTPKWFSFIFKYHLLFIRLFFKYPIHNYIKLEQRNVDEIKSTNPDIIWVYGEEMSNVVKQFGGYKRIHTLPDCESLYYYRMMEQRFAYNHPLQYWKCALMYRKFRNMERNFENSDTITYHLVGEEDASSLRNLNPCINAQFIRHPHYVVKDENKPIKFHQPKIKLLIAGQYNHYMQQSADEALKMMCNNTLLKEYYEITFLGKRWESWNEKLSNSGYKTQQISFAPDYIEEICKHDVQLTPICIGTGTKGKVLDALANGLMVIGTPFALENIAVKDDESCKNYKDPTELMKILLDIPLNVKKYEHIANKGRENVIKYHNNSFIAKQLFNIQ